MKTQIVTSAADLDRLEELIGRSAELAADSMRAVLVSASGLDALALLKFTEAGRDPLQEARSLNLIEQLNQTFTYLASIAAARWLFANHPECESLTLNLGTSRGFDIESACGKFVAEVSAVTKPSSNNKLNKDVAKMATSSAPNRFVFYMSPVAGRSADSSGVTIVRVDHGALNGLSRVRVSAAPANDGPSTS